MRVTVGQDPETGRGQQRSFTHHGNEETAKAVQAQLVALHGVRKMPAPPSTAAMTVRELLGRFLDSSHTWSPNTWRSHGSAAKLISRDRFSQVRLDRMTPDSMERAISRWVQAGLSVSVISGRFRVLHAAISWALDNKLILQDPLEGMSTPSRPHPRLHLRPGEVRKLLIAADAAVDKARAQLQEHPNMRGYILRLFRAEQDALLIRLAADSGARRGELVALRTTDLTGRVLAINRASQDGIIGPVKNHLNGQLTLGSGTAAYWHEHVRSWAKFTAGARKSSGDGGEGAWLFSATPERSTPLLPNGLGQRFRKLAHAAGLPEATLHRLRHTVGTFLVSQGKILQASARLRHKDVATTLREYAHALPLNDEDIADTLDNLYGLSTALAPPAA
ncbi:tyrosine-type recombinase/integrase [Actinocatenispora comari]|uniref:Site-specific integrase n=1 Tax=Actinocatenispora comari TaxID=2807577 RepID=A0A8J4AD50_9ACTN|nr:tyrosine-type recombinase/integrase [Actinocatenispora comari]GIL29174.1 hypothetical protein NUM_44280 [Actinocatenispora comari]